MRKLGLRGALLVVGMLAVVVAGACGSDDEGGGGKKGGSITIAQTSQPDFLDPALSYTVNGWEPLWLVYTPPLTYKHAEGKEGTELIPGVAEAMPKLSNGDKTYTFTIRKGVKYSDGQAVKASDFEHAIKRVLNLESGAAPFYETIEGAEEYEKAGEEDGDISGIETNDQTGEVKVTLKEPDGTFLNVLAMTFAAPVPSDTPFKNMSKDPPPGVGPYQVSKSVPNREFVMERVKTFNIPNIPKGNIDTITTRIVKSAERQTQDVINGRLDYMQDPPPADLLPEVRSKYKDRYEEHTTVSTYYFFMDLKIKPFNKKEVRDAVNYAVDSKALARLFGGRLEPSCNFLPKDMPGYKAIDPCPWGDPNEPGDLAKARDLVKKAGEDGTAVTVYTNNDENRPEIGQYYADLLNKIGLKAKLRTIDGGVYFATVGNAKTRAQTGFDNWFQDFPHPGNFMFLMATSSIQPTNGQNHGDVSDPKLDRLIKTVNSGPASDPEVEDAAAEADRMIVENSYAAPYGSEKLATFLSERMDFENCSLFHPLYLNDYSSFCLK